MLNQRLHPAMYRDLFMRRGRLQIRELLQEQAAGALLECLQKEVPWTLAVRHEGRSQTLPRERYAAMDEAGRAQLLRELAAEAAGQYGFAYESYPMITNYMEKRDPDLLLHRITEYLNSGEFLYFARTLTGFPQIQRVSAQATRYRPGHFLRRHDDSDVEEGRLVAYVINLTPAWNADFGGLLHFINKDGSIEETFYPYFNSLSIFRVPQLHFVSGVQSYATEERLAITGWFRT